MSRLVRLTNQLQAHLDKDEAVRASIKGQYETTRLGATARKTGAMFATDRRVVFFAKRLFGFDLEHFPYKNISSFEMGKKFMGYYITFFSNGNHVSLKWIDDGSVDEFARVVRELMDFSHITSSPVDQAKSLDVFGQLERLGQLRDSGTITPSDFEAKKKDLLSRL